MNPTVDKFFDTIDAIALRLRMYLKSLFGALVFVQGLIALNLAPFAFLTTGKWATYVGILNALVGYFTVRSGKVASDLKEVARVGGSATMARIPTPPPGETAVIPCTPGAIPSSEMNTPTDNPSRGIKP